MKWLISFLGGRWVIVSVIASLLAGAGLWIRHEIVSYGDRRAAEIQADWDIDANERRLAATGQQEIERVKGAQHAIDLDKERAQRAQDAVVIGTVLAGNTVELDRLRRAASTYYARFIQASASNTPGPSADATAEPGGVVLGECAGRLVTMADTAEQLGLRLRGLQAWASSAVMVCGDDRPP